jgi:hypothetical protein
MEKGVKSRNNEEISKLHHLTQKPDLFNGLSRKYLPLSDDGEQFPPENRKVQATVADVLRSAVKATVETIDVETAKDAGNCVARADIILADGTCVVTDLPATTLLSLEKEMNNWRTFVSKLPVLDPAEDWNVEQGNTAVHRTAPIRTHRTNKVQESLVLISPTPEHPGQAQVITRDVIAGHWETVKLSGAMSADRKAALLEKANALSDAVKSARERANLAEVPNRKIGEDLFKFLLAE